MRAWIACLVMVGCTSPLAATEMDVTTITPPSGPADKTQDVRIEGLGFEPRLVSNLDDGTTSFDDTLTVTIGNTPLLGAMRIDAGAIIGTVPANLAPGTYDVTVTLGAETDTLAAAYTVDDLPPPPLVTTIGIDDFTSAPPALYTNGFQFTHTVGTNANRVLVVGLSISFAGTTATSVTCNGQPLTQLVAFDAPSMDGRVELWGVAAPASGPAQIQVTLASGNLSTVIAGAASFSNVDQATPFKVPGRSSSTAGSPTINVTASAGDVSFGLVMWNGGEHSSLIPQQQAAWNSRIANQGNGNSIVGAASIATDNTQFLWNVADATDDFWVCVGIALQEGV